METKASAKFIRMSPKKVRLVADLIRGLDVEAAAVQLRFSKKHAALPLAKLLQSAIANAEENDKLKKNNLFIRAITVDEGPALKRWMPRAMGRATPLRKMSSHIKIILAEKVPTEKKEKVKPIDTKEDVVKIEDLGNLLPEEKKTEKKIAAKDDKKGQAKSGGKSLNKFFNRTGNK